MLKILIHLLTSLLLTQNISASTTLAVGTCIHDPNASLLQAKWNQYLEVKKKKAKINISKIKHHLRMDTETMKLLQAISEVESLMKTLDLLEAKFLKKAFIDTRFNEMIASSDFIQKLENRQMDNEIKQSALPFKNDQRFYDLLDLARVEISKKEVKDALELFRIYDLGILEVAYRTSAKAALKIIRSKGATLEIVRSWIKDPPYLKNIPLPKASLGPFAIKYRLLLSKSVSNFVLENTVTLEEAKKIFPKIKTENVLEMNSMLPPTEINSFDDHIYGLADKNSAAIDGVARTLWGEATSCQVQGLPQFEAIGKIISERSLAVCRAIKEQDELTQKNTIVREKNWTTFLSNWAGITRPAPGMQNKASGKLRGLGDFGRKEKKDMPCAAQVISKKNQFSVWNSYTVKKFQTGKKHPNIPDTSYEIQGPQSSNDDKALVRILCPEFQTEDQKKLWKHAVDIATEIVQSPEKLNKRMVWPVNDEILFYTHDAPLPFAREVKASTIIVNGIPQQLRSKNRGACSKFRLFSAKIPGTY